MTISATVATLKTTPASVSNYNRQSDGFRGSLWISLRPTDNRQQKTDDRGRP